MGPIEQFFKEEHGRLMAALISQFKDFELAEDALQEAMLTALGQKDRWQNQLPENFFGWVLLAAKRKAIDILRRENLGRFKTAQLATRQQAFMSDDHILKSVSDEIEDERLGLLFTCCHPALNSKSQMVLTLRCIAGLKMNEIARGLMMKDSAVRQVFTRARGKIREAGIGFGVASVQVIPERLEMVMAVIYLIFNEGYAASEGVNHIRYELCAEAISLAQMLCQLQPDSAEALGLLALMLYHDARKDARLGPQGELIALDQQDPAKFDQQVIAAATEKLNRSFKIRIGGYYQTQAHIAALHARVSEPEINWAKVAFLYEQLLTYRAHAVVYLNYAVALLESNQLEQASAVLLDEAVQESLASYPYYFAARARLSEKQHEPAQAAAHYDKAISLTNSAYEKRHLQKKRQALSHA